MITIMIKRAERENIDEIKRLWKVCFPDVDERYQDFFFKNVVRPEDCYIKVLEGKIVATLVRNKHALMFNSRVLQASMIMGVAVHPEYRHRGYMHEMMDIIVDACEHSELLTLIQTEKPEMYEPFGFRTIYQRTQFQIQRKDVTRITNFGCAYDPAPLDLLKVYSAFIKRFNGFYARDLGYFVNYKKEIKAVGGKIVAYYNGKDQIQGYAAMIPDGEQLKVQEMIYLDSMSLIKLCNAALQERKIVNLYVSEAEDLSKVFPEALKKSYPSTMARLNDPKLFTKLFRKKIDTIEEAFAISHRPLNLNEFS